MLLLWERLGAEALHLKGFKLVDPANRRVSQADLWVEGGKIVAAAAAARVIEGQGRYLMPALWDMRASLWGNESAKNWEVLTQDLGISQCLRVQLFYGVAHVTAVFMEREWVGREAKRAEAMEFPAAELLYPDKALGGPGGKAWAIYNLTQTAQVGPLLDELKSRGVPFVTLMHGEPAHKYAPGLGLPMLKETLKQAKRRGMKSFVLASDWAHALEAVSAGATAVQAFSREAIPAELLRQMRERGCYFAPRLVPPLELARLLGNPKALADPFLAESVPTDILKSFEDPAGLWEGWLATYQSGKNAEASALASLKRAAESGVALLSSTDSGWTAGTFQGYSTHAMQAYMEKAGVDPWARLRAATSWPAAFVGRKLGFESGAPADFVALDSNPLESAAHLRKISFLVRNGEYVGRDSLKLDFSRSKFRP